MELRNTQKTQNDFINNLAYIAHHKHAYILSTIREIARESKREKGEKIFAVQKKNSPN